MNAFYLHTNIPSPYRHHFFRMVCDEFPGSMVVYTEKMHDDRSWKDDPTRQSYPTFMLPRRIFIPRVGYLNPGLLPLILRQPKRAIHLIGACGGGNRYLLRAFAQHRGSTLVEWNDGGFPEHFSDRGRWLSQRIFAPALKASFAPGLAGREFSRAVGIPEHRIFNAYFSHDVDEYACRRQRFGQEYRKSVRARLGIDLEHFVILTVSRFLALKRLEDLHEALRNAQHQMKDDCHLILIGDGSHQGPLKAMQRDFSKIKLHWVRAVEYQDMPRYYAAADLLVFPSEGDVWGLVVNEALSMGVPVICTNRIGAAEIVREGEDGFVVPPRRMDLLTERILQLYHNRELHQVMSRRCVEIGERWNSRLAIQELHRMIEVIGG